MWGPVHWTRSGGEEGAVGGADLGGALAEAGIAVRNPDQAFIEARCEVRYQSDTQKPAELELFENLRIYDDGTPSYLVTRINRDSSFVRVSADAAWKATQPDLSKFPVAVSPDASGWVAPTTRGDDKIASLSTDDFVGVDLGPGSRTGICALEDIDVISLCMAPGIWAKDVHSALITHCENLRYRFAIIDPPPSEYLDLAHRLDADTIKGPVDTKYAFRRRARSPQGPRERGGALHL